MKRLFALAALSLLFACTPEENGVDNHSGNSGNGSSNLAPSVTVGADHVSAISAVLQGKANLGTTAASDLQIGFQYSKSAGIMPSNSTTVMAEDADANYNYTSNVTGLEPATTYYFRSFVRQNGQDTYGETKSFTTKEFSSLLTTQDATAVTATSSALNATADLSDVSVAYKTIEYGFYWGTSESSQPTKLSGGDISGNAYSASLTNLSHKTQYWYKAYLKLDNQTFFGEVKSFTTDVVPVGSVSLDKTEYTFHTIGNTLTLTATVLPSDATNRAVEWTSSDTNVATVDQNGTVKAVDNGTATITVTTKDQGKTATCSVTVKVPYTAVAPEAVDLGIVVNGKNIKWGSFNLGATKLEEYGDYFAWGETAPKDNYAWSTYTWCNGSSSTLTKYNNTSSYGTVVDNKTVLDSDDDAAHAALGGKWRMPTDAEWTELRTKCTWTWVTNYNGSGINGRLVSSKTNGNSIFLPAASYRFNTNLNNAGSYGSYWSSSLSTGHPYNAYRVSFGSDRVNRDYGNLRCSGNSVRPVTE